MEPGTEPPGGGPVSNWTAGAPTSPIAQKDAAETFAEGDVTTSLANADIETESVRIKDPATSAAGPGSLTGGGNSVDIAGVTAVPNRRVSELTVTFSAYESGDVATEVRVTRQSDGEILYQETGLSVGDGETHTAAVDLSAETSYSIEVATSGTYQQASTSGTSEEDVPFTSEVIDITNGAYEGDKHTTGLFSITEIEAKANDREGSVSISWPNPPDVYRWDAASYQATQDGETVDVFVEADDGSGWTEIAGPINRGDQINADPGSEVRFRVDLSREDVANSPTLDAIYRRWVV